MWFDFMLHPEYKRVVGAFVDCFTHDIDSKGAANAFIIDGQLSVYYDTYEPFRKYGERAGRWYTHAVEPDALDGFGPRIYPMGLSPMQMERRRRGLDRGLLFPQGAKVRYRHHLPFYGPDGEDLASYGDAGLVLEACDDAEGMVMVQFMERVTAPFSAALVLNQVEWQLHEFGWNPWQAVDDLNTNLRWRSTLPLPEVGSAVWA